MFSLLKYRHKYQRLVDQHKKQVKAELDKADKASKVVVLNEEEIEE